MHCPARLIPTLLIAAITLAGCNATGDEASRPAAAAGLVRPVSVHAQTAPGASGEPNGAAIWINPADAGRSLVLGATGSLEIYGLNGERLARQSSLPIEHISVTRAFHLHDQPTDLAVGYDRNASALVAFTIDPAAPAAVPVTMRPLFTEAEVTGLCAFRSSKTGRHYAFAVTDDGQVQQWELYERGGKVDGRMVRLLPFGVGAGYCAVDEAADALYVTEETVGIWKLRADPETDAERELVDLAGPRGHLSEEVKGIAIYEAAGARTYLFAADVAAGRLNVYSTDDAKYIGSITLQGTGGTGSLKAGEFESLAASSVSLGGGLEAGVLVVADQGTEGTPAGYRLLSGAQIMQALGIAPTAASASASAAQAPVLHVVMPTVETDPVDDYGDAADDPAIWVHPTDPAQSVIIGAQKKRGLYVYDLSGKTLQVVSDGRMNNVDLRHGFTLGGSAVAIVAASNRTDKTLALYKVDPTSRRLSNIAAGSIPTGFDDPYGLCMYRSPKTADFYVFMNNSDGGVYKQWRLREEGGRVAAEVVREFTVGTQAEGCAADDETGALYIAEEDVGLWRYEAEPTGADRRVALDDTTKKGHLKADVEGIAIYYGEGGKGYVIVSNQGDDNYAVYRREDGNEFLGHFAIIANPEAGIDGASETDGLDVISTPLGPAFPYGVLVVQDGRNISPAARQNFKLVPWERVAAAMSLQQFTGRNPNRAH